jgi:hypothetical protein
MLLEFHVQKGIKESQSGYTSFQNNMGIERSTLMHVIVMLLGGHVQMVIWMLLSGYINFQKKMGIQRF